VICSWGGWVPYLSCFPFFFFLPRGCTVYICAYLDCAGFVFISLRFWWAAWVFCFRIWGALAITWACRTGFGWIRGLAFRSVWLIFWATWFRPTSRAVRI
jgi:hypothetical protein